MNGGDKDFLIIGGFFIGIFLIIGLGAILVWGLTKLFSSGSIDYKKECYEGNDRACSIINVTPPGGQQ